MNRSSDMKFVTVIIALVLLVQSGHCLRCYTCLFPTLSPMDCIKFPITCAPKEKCLSSTATGRTTSYTNPNNTSESMKSASSTACGVCCRQSGTGPIIVGHPLKQEVRMDPVWRLLYCTCPVPVTCGTAGFSTEDFPFVLHEMSCAATSLCGISGEKTSLGINVTYHNACCDTDLCNSATVAKMTLSFTLLPPLLLLLLS